MSSYYAYSSSSIQYSTSKQVHLTYVFVVYIQSYYSNVYVYVNKMYYYVCGLLDMHVCLPLNIQAVLICVYVLYGVQV